MKKTNQTVAMRVSRNTIAANVLLSGFKLFAGITAHSAAMLSDAVHSLSDVFSTVIVMVGVRIAGKRADREHPYGHERFECVAALLLAVLLCATGLGIGWGGVQAIWQGNYGNIRIPGRLALVAAVVSIVVKEAMYWYTKAAAGRIQSGALMADAWHHRSDALSSVGSLVGIAGARMGLAVLDPLACLVICAFILKAAYTIFRDAVDKMTDRACDEETVQRIREIVLRQPEVEGVDLLRTRLFGDRVYVEVEISVDGDASLHLSHGVAQRVHDEIERHFESVKHCMVHVNPVEK